MNKPSILVVFTSEGMEPPVINADTEQEQVQMEEILRRIQPCLDVADAIIKRSSAGPKG